MMAIISTDQAYVLEIRKLSRALRYLLYTNIGKLRILDLSHEYQHSSSGQDRLS